MIRLAVNNANDPLWGQIASRLRGAILETCGDDSPQTCDAAVFFQWPESDGVGIERFLHAGKHVLLSMDLWGWADTSRILPGLQRCGVVNLDRYLPSCQLIRKQLDAGKLGEPGLIRVHRWEPEDVWAFLPRTVDLLLWYFGRLPDRVYAVGEVQVHLGFTGGGMALLDIARLPGGCRYQLLSVIGSSGAACTDDHQNMQLVYSGGCARAIQTTEGTVYLSAMVQEIVDALNAGREVPGNPSAWRDVVTVSTAALESLQTHKAVILKGGN